LKGESKGFGFVECVDYSSLTNILSEKHSINGQIVDCNHAFDRGDNRRAFRPKEGWTIFIGGLRNNTDMCIFFN